MNQIKNQSKFEFDVNQCITLRLEHGNTVIYVAGEKFMQCKFLLINIPIKKMDYLSNLDSIDEISERLDSSLEHKKTNLVIPPETEFWGHCSNLQIWSENDYNTDLLHSNLAFPLLKRLTEVNDTQAKKVFKKEIIKRLKRGYLPSIVCLAESGCLDQFNQEELFPIFREIDFDYCYYPSNLDSTNKYVALKLFKDLFENCPSYIKPIIKPKLKEKTAKYLINAVDEDLHLYDRDLGNFSVEDYLIYLNDDELEMCIKELKFKLSSEGFKNFKESEIFDGTRLMTLLLKLKQDVNEMEIVKQSELEMGIQLRMFDSNDSQSMFRFLSDQIQYCLVNHGKVIRINLVGFKITNVPKQLCELKSLERLEVSKNRLMSLPKEIERLKSLRYLDLSHNKITYLPESIGNLKKLTHLDLSHNRLAELPVSIGNLKLLEELHLDRNNLKKLPESIGNLRLLKSLEVNQNNLEILPETIGDLKILEKLSLKHNKLLNLPESLGSLKSLEMLIVGYNRLNSLPKSISNLKSLTSLYIGQNFNYIPDIISELESLTMLEIGNLLTIIPKNVIHLQSVKSLSFRDNLLNCLPDFIGSLKGLEYLNLSNNNITSLPESIGNLKGLEYLKLPDNNITSLPESIGNLKGLINLNLSNNNITSLPESIGNLKELKILELDNNNLEDLPYTIGDLKHLEYLNLKYNKITELPESIGNLHSLNRLRLNKNPLNNLPNSIFKLNPHRLRRLITLDYEQKITLEKDLEKLERVVRRRDLFFKSN